MKLNILVKLKTGIVKIEDKKAVDSLFRDDMFNINRLVRDVRWSLQVIKN